MVLPTDDAAEGRRVPQGAELDRTIQNVMRIVAHKALAYQVRDVESLQDEALAGIERACRTYRPESGYLWKTWLNRCVDWAIREGNREGGRRRTRAYEEFSGRYRVISLDTWNGEPGQSLDDEIPDPGADFEGRVEARLMAEEILSHLDGRDRHIMEQKYLRGRTDREIGQQIGLSRGRIGQIVSEILARLREEFLRQGKWEGEPPTD